ncbi:MAG: DegT/DnrJ/EryC1/StrS family aminotransferase [bacterium]|nr:DegT/DnrJ/EryC1/StrS family aminotransferase [bacterium]
MPYQVRFVNPQKQYADHRDELLKAADDVWSRGALVNQKDLQDFEKHFAEFVGAKFAVGVNSGTSALDVALQAAGIKSGDEVITVAHTFMASISTICLTRAVPVLIDVGRDFNMDVSQLEAALTPMTKAIMPVHLNGRLCDMDVVLDVAKRKGLIVIEDAAQALGATLKMKGGETKSAGTFGLIGCFSLYFAKVLGGLGNNGIAVTDNVEVAHKLKLMRYNGEDRETREFSYHAHNFLMDNVHAALLDIKLKYLPLWLTRRKEIAARYHEGLAGIKQVETPNFPDSRFIDIYTNYAIRAERRDELKKYFTDNESVETIISWPRPTYTEPNMANDKALWRFGIPGNVLPETEKICQEVISLPCYPELTNEDIDAVINAVKSFYSKT